MLLLSWVLFFHFCIFDLILKILIILSFASFSFCSRVIELLRSSCACLRHRDRDTIIGAACSPCWPVLVSQYNYQRLEHCVGLGLAWSNYKHLQGPCCLQPPPRQSWSSHCRPANHWRPWSLKQDLHTPSLLASLLLTWLDVAVDEGILWGRDRFLPADVPEPPVTGRMWATRQVQVLIGAKLSFLSLLGVLLRPSPLTVCSATTSILQSWQLWALTLTIMIASSPVQSIPVRLLEKDLLRFRLELELLDTFVFRVPFLFNLSSKLFFLESFFRCVVSFLFSTAWFLPFLSLAFRGWNSIRYYDSEEPVTQPTRPNTPPVWQLGTKTDWLYLMMSESVGLKRMIIVLNWSSGVFSLSTTTMVGIGWIIVLQYSVVPLSSWQPLAKN